MSKRSIWILWAAGLFVSLTLFTVGIGRPWLAAWRHSQNPPRLELRDGQELDESREYQATLERIARETRMNYWVGAALPGLILGGVLFAILRAPGRGGRS